MTRRRVYNGCGRKRGYPTKEQADAADGAKLLRAYQCEVCGKWHHTSMTPTEYKAAQASRESA